MSPPPPSPPARDIGKNWTAAYLDSTSSSGATPRPSPTTSSPADSTAPLPAPRTKGERKQEDEVASAGKTPPRNPGKEEGEEVVVASARKKMAQRGYFRFPALFGGMRTSEAGGDSSGRSVSNSGEHVVDIDGPPLPPAPTSVEAEGRYLAGLIRRAQLFSNCVSGHLILADPSAQLTLALQTFAAAARTTKAKAARLGLELAAAALYEVSSNPKLEVIHAMDAKQLAYEAAALVASRREQKSSASGPWAAGQHPSSSSTELFWVAIAGSLALLPYLTKFFPTEGHFVVALIFGVVFCGASIGGVMSVRAMHNKCADIVGVFSLTALSVLVFAFVAFALVQGNI